MKKLLLIVVAMVLVGGFSFAAQPGGKKPMNAFADIGLSVSDFKGMFVDAGLQYGFSEKLFGEFLFEYYFAPAGSGIDSSAYGLNLNGVYKHKLQEKLVLFGKAGLSMIHTSVTFDLPFALTASAGRVAGLMGGASSTKLGLNAGIGIEYTLNGIAIRGGATFKTAFSDPGTTWFKIYGGASYKF